MKLSQDLGRPDRETVILMILGGFAVAFAGSGDLINARVALGDDRAAFH